ncbi:MAG: hypothetical protein AB8G05_22395 [Oligoflexales bacterium]
MNNKLLMMLGIAYFFSFLAKGHAEIQNPILSWNENMSPLPMLDLVFLDPEMKHTIFDKKSLERSLEKWQDTTKKSEGQAKNPKAYLRKSINFLKHFNHVLVRNYYENNFREISGYKIAELSTKIRRELSFLLSSLLAHKLEPEERSLHAFQKYLVDFQIPSLREKAVKSLEPHPIHILSDQRKRLILFGSYLVDLYKEGPESTTAMQGLNHISPYMSKEANTLSQLYLARLKLGYGFDGKKIGSFKPTYHRHIKIIANLCNSFSDTQNSQVLASILSIWAKAKDFVGSWDKLPINTSCYRDLTPFLATRERVALKHWHKKEHQEAYEIYDHIADKTSKESTQILIQKRILKLAKLIYLDKQNIIFYQGVYAKALKLVRHTQFRMQLRSDLFMITQTYLTTVYRKHNSIPNLESIVNNFLAHSSNSDNSRKISILEAKILHRMQDYEKAWKAYYNLSKNTKKSSQRILDLEEAIRNYALNYKWSLEKPWTNLKEKPKREHQKFEHLHLELLSIAEYKAPRSWDKAINLGMLYLINKRANQAYELWKPYWNQNPKIKFTNAVGGALLKRLHELQSWNLISEFLVFIKEHKLAPEYLEKKIPVKKYEEKATYEIGKKALTNMELLKAEQAFENLIHNFRKSLNYQDYLAYMIKTSKLLQKYKPLKFYLEKYLELGRDHADFEKKILSLIELLKGMGKIKETFKYAKKYIDYYPEDIKTQKQFELIVKLCETLPKNYCAESSHKISKTINQLNAYDRLKEKIISQKHHAKTASKNLDSKKLREIESEIINLGKNNPMVKDTINYVWFAQIKIISDSLVKKLRSRKIKSDEAIEQYENIRQTFMGICNRKSVSSCAQSFKELLFLTTEMKSFLALSDHRHLLNTYSELEMKLKKRMSRYLSRNITEPKVAQKILWETMKEWNFDNDPYTGIGYIQLIEYANKPQFKG